MEDTQNQQPIDTDREKLITLLTKIKQFLINLPVVLSSKKMITYLISGIITILLLVIILGILFGKKTSTSTNKVISTSTPIPTQESSSPTNDYLEIQKSLLNTIKTDILNFDIGQQRLKPPTLNFKIKF